MKNIETAIEGSEKLISIFGRWPSFHDAEIIELQLWRGDVNPDKERYTFPVLTLKMHCFEMTKEVNAEGYFVLRNHTPSTFKFHNVEDLKTQGFNHQNAIFGLSINKLERSQPPSLYFTVELERAFGIEASFTCLRVEVSEAIPCGSDGNVVQQG